MAIATTAFDYEGIDKDIKGMLRSIAGDIRRSTKSHLDYAIQMGESVTQANELFAKSGCEGKFGAWVKAECGFSKRSAYNYMNAFARFGGNRASLAQFTAEAVYLLSEDSVSDDVVAQAIKMAGKGQRITKEAAVELKRLDAEQNQPEDEPEEESTAVQDNAQEDVVEPVSVSETDPPPVRQYADTFDTSTFGSGSIDLAAKQAPYDAMLNAITVITKNWNAVTDDERDGVYAVDKKNRVNQILKDLRPPIAQARPHALCDHCEGEGCKKCQNCGWWPRSVVEGLKK
jgi:hypothetical protein